MESDRQWLTRPEAAEYLRLGLPRFDSLCRKGVITRYRIAGQGSPRFSRKELDKTLTPKWSLAQ